MLLKCGEIPAHFSPKTHMPPCFDQPIRLLPIFRERVWGRASLAPYFSEIPAAETSTKEPIGEVWFSFTENLTSAGISLGELLKREPGILGSARNPRHPGICPLLVKLLFTTERLSVQVHPDDEYAQTHHGCLGKTEAWYVMEAEPEAEVALGFKQEISTEKLREAAISGEIEQLLDWRRVKPGDMIYTPAGTVHAIGAGLTICEIQENSDITYRLYDYGRPRELHLDHGARVSQLGPHTFDQRPVALASWRRELLASPYFRIEHLRPLESLRIAGGLPYYLLLVCLNGSGTIGGQTFTQGECWMIPAGSRAVEVQSTNAEWLLTYTADKPASGLAGK